MGTKYQVWAWECIPGESKDSHASYKYIERYSGEWLIVALLKAAVLKWAGVGCVKIEWR